MAANEVELWVPRSRLSNTDVTPDYTCYPDYFTLKVYHGGCLRNNTYVGGEFCYYDHVDKDRMSLIEVDNMVTQLNPMYAGQVICYFYRVGDETNELELIKSDADVMRMCNLVPQWRLIKLYLDHMDAKRALGFEEEDVFMYEEILFGEKRMKSSCVIEELPEEPRPATKGIQIREIEDVVPTQASQVGGLNPKDKGKQKLNDNVVPKHKKRTALAYNSSDVGCSGSGEGCSSSMHREGIGGVQEAVDYVDYVDYMDYMDHMQTFGEPPNEEPEDESESEDEDADYEPDFNDEGYDHYGTDEDERIEENLIVTEAVKSSYKTSEPGLHEMEVEDDEDMFASDGSDEENIQFHKVKVDGELKDDGIIFNPKTDMKEVKFCLNMKFATMEILRDAVTEFAIQGGWEFGTLKSDKTRLRVICRAPNCLFLLFASKLSDGKTFKIKTLNPEHKCTRLWDNKMVKRKYLTKKFKDEIALNPNIEPEKLMNKMSSTIRAGVSKTMAYRTKVAAVLEIEGNIREQYARLGDYGRELQRVDPATTFDLKCDFNNSEKSPVFKRMYICLGALKNGFKAGCRSLIGLDGAHLKTCFGGQLLTAVGIDANNTSWVVAYAMVELENKDAWIWFLELLCKDLSINNNGRGWIFISDKQKGLVPAFNEVVPSASIRFCARHLWTNFTQKFPGLVMKDAMWKCAKATTLPYYETAMEEMKELNKDAYDWLTDPDRPPKHWCRAFFPAGYDCDMLINNANESFNAWILKARCKPPITMLEEIRVKLMSRIRVRREKMVAYHRNICPKIRNVIEKNKVKAAEQCTPTFSGELKAEVANISGTKNVVDVGLRTCTCRIWDLTGIPCKHAISTLFGLRLEPDDYVSPCYLKETYMRIYDNCIQPANSMELWGRGDGPKILPPAYTRQPGRPKKNRAKHGFETVINGTAKAGGEQRSVKCGNCGQTGHNKVTCKSHLPSKKTTTSTKKKTTNAEGSQQQKQRRGPLTPNELRKKLEEKRACQRDKMAALRAERLGANRPRRGRPPTRQPTTFAASTATRPPTAPAPTTSRVSRPFGASSAPAPTTSRASSDNAATSTRSSKRVRPNSGKGNDK